jgi:acyl dehydratase
VNNCSAIRTSAEVTGGSNKKSIACKLLIALAIGLNVQFESVRFLAVVRRPVAVRLKGKVVEFLRTKCVFKTYSDPSGIGVSLFTSLRSASNANRANSD